MKRGHLLERKYCGEETQRGTETEHTTVVRIRKSGRGWSITQNIRQL